MKRRTSRSRRTSRKKSVASTIFKSIPRILIFFALFFGWIYANILLIQGYIYPNMIVPMSAKIAEQVIKDNSKKSFSGKDISKYTSIIMVLSTLLSLFFELKDANKGPYAKVSKIPIYSFIIGLWAEWIGKSNISTLKINRNQETGKFIGITRHYTNNLSDQDLLRLSTEFATLAATVIGLPAAQIYALAKMRS